MADLAGVPPRVTARARKILQRLERGEHLALSSSPDSDPNQVSLFTLLEEPLRARLADLDLNTLSPLDALHLLAELVEEAKSP